MPKGKIFILSGPSGSGKTTLHKRIFLDKRIQKALVKTISMTTRSPRSGEKNGRDYLFVSLPKFLGYKDSGHFLEWQKVFDNYYGTPKIVVQKLLEKSKNVLLCIDVKGARVVVRQFPEAIMIFIKPPSWDILKKRLLQRETQLTKNLRLRLDVARREMKEAKRYRYCIVNDDLSMATKDLKAIIFSELKNK